MNIKLKIYWVYPLLIMVFLFQISFSFPKNDKKKVKNRDTTITATSTVTDIDGYVYNTIKIGTQIWMKENLKVTKYNDSTPIPQVKDGTAWNNLSTPGDCWYNNDKATYDATYGALYNWYAVNTNKLCPAGWHIPSDAEWTILENYLIENNFNYDGATMGNNYAKSLAATTNWISYTGIGTVGNTDYSTKRDSTGFTALPGGLRYMSGMFGYIGSFGYWWSSTEFYKSTAWIRAMYCYESAVYRNNYYKQSCFSVRCVMDN